MNGENTELELLSHLENSVRSVQDFFDIAVDNHCIEVKSCIPFPKTRGKTVIGRFLIKTENHLKFKDYLKTTKKVGGYFFVLSFKGKRIWKYMPIKKVKINPKIKYNNISWLKIFRGEKL